MQKFLQIAEKHVQWLALAIGAAYLGFMGWSYVYQPNINVTLGGKVVEPGEVERVIADGPIKDLNVAMDNATVVKITPRDVLWSWDRHVKDSFAVLDPLPPVVPTDLLGGANSIVPGVGPGGEAPKLAKLPTLPAATPVAVASYRTLIEFADPAFDAANAPAGAAPPIITKDIDAVSVEFKVDMKALAKSFTDAFPPNALQQVFQTMYLRVSLFREEWDPAGKIWGNQTEIPVLPINKPNFDYPGPGNTPPPHDAMIYEAWAGANQELIIHPPFYQTAPGAEVWVMPDQIAPPAAPAAGAGGNAPDKPGARPAAGGASPRDNAGAAIAQPLAARPAPQPAGGGWQGNVFNPLLKNADDVIIAHDVTVVPEKTYRYYIQYRLLNSLFGANRGAVDMIIKPFALLSPGPDKSKPTDKIIIPSRTHIFVKNIQGGAAHFEVFQWNPNPTQFEVSATPGDAVAPSPWILVDVRKDPAGLYVLLADANGNEMRRELQKDTADETRLDDEKAAAAAKPPAAGPLAPAAPAAPPAAARPRVVPPSGANSPGN